MRTGAGVVGVAWAGRKRLRAMGVVVVAEAWESLRRVPPKVLMVALVVKAILISMVGLGEVSVIFGRRGRAMN